MEQQKAGLLSSLSLGRMSRSPRIPSASSTTSTNETIAHPLLGASTSSLNLPGDIASGGGPDASSSGHPARTVSGSKVAVDPSSLPYKPRQRHGHERSQSGSGNATDALSPISTATTASTTIPASPAGPTVGVSALPTTSTSTSTTFALPPSAMDTPSAQLDPFSGLATSSSSATSRLQLQSLKAAAQQIGLGNGSMGMGMIDAIYEKGQLGRAKVGDGGDWGDLLRVLVTGKAVIFLPSSPASSLPMTPQTLRDHIAFLSPPLAASDSSTTCYVVVTLSGLIGTLQSDQLAFEATIPVDSPLIATLREGTNRAGVLSTLRPTDIVSSPPSYPLSSETAVLSFPPLGKGGASSGSSVEGKPERREKDPSTKFGRINPFALFGSSQHAQQSSSPSNTEDQPLTNPTSSPRPSSLLSLDAETASIQSDLTVQGDGYQVTAYIISRPIRYADVHKSLVKALRTSIRTELDSLPDKVIERVSKLVLASICPISSGAVDTNLLKSHHVGSEPDEPLDFSDPQGCGVYLQSLMESVYDDLISHHRSEPTGGLKRKTSGTVPWNRGPSEDASSLKDHSTLRQQREEIAEHEASEGTERVEALVCRLLYNRIFSPLGSDDSRHDEALASRIAALNMLDLSLDHLGLITRPENEVTKGALAAGLSNLVKSVGTELQKLSLSRCLSPKDKADVLVSAHKVVVDGLAKLPPVKLRPEGEPYKAPPQELEEEASFSEPVELNPLMTIAEVSERTPLAQGNNPNPSVPDLVLPDSATPQSQPAEAEIEEALASSVLGGLSTEIEQPEHKDTPETSEAKGSPATPEPKEDSAGTSGADLILPIIIYAVVKSNPAQLASQLQYLRRFRSAICLTGEASYAIVNLTAVVEFLEHVQLSDLGLGDDSDRVISVEDLDPITLSEDDNADAASIASASSRLRGRVFQVGELAAGSANKVITGVVDSSLSALRGFIGTGPEGVDAEMTETVPAPRPGMRPRQASTFSLASVTASVANIAAAATTAAARTRSRASSRASEQVWGGNQEMIDVSSRPASVRERDPVIGGYSDEEPESDNDSINDKAGAEEEHKSHSRSGSFGRQRAKSDARSIMSVSSALSRDNTNNRRDDSKSERVSIGDRLATIGVLGRISHPSNTELSSTAMESPSSKPGLLPNLTTRSASASHGRRSSLLAGSLNSPAGSTFSLPISPAPTEPLEPPMERFMTCELGDIRLHEVGTLLRDYRRLAAIVNRMQQTPSPQP